MSTKTFLSYGFWISLSIIVGISLSFVSVKITRFSYDYSVNTLGSAMFNFISPKGETPSIIYQKNKETKEISLVFTGDIMLDRGVEKSVIKNFNNDFSFLFQGVDFLKNADISFGNLEGPISDTGKNLGNLYSFRMDPAAIGALKEAGFDVLSVANNHIGDWGRTAFDDTLLNLRNKDIEPCGEKIDPAIIEKNNLKIGFLCFSDVGPIWLKAFETQNGILIYDDSAKEIIKNASDKVDILVVSFHFGEEYKKEYNKRQEEISHLAIDNGAKIVIGHHPHVIQDTEFYKNGLIAYSLGNFIFDQNFSEETMKGLVLKVVVSENNIKSIDKKIIKINNLYQPEYEK
ncbi:MAG: CapA family protein [Candidatus Parcubacteria bacterium]|nr:CapA family protein [Candidatus Parcubacteria bacterium]